MQQAFYRSENNQALRELCSFAAGCGVRFKCHGVSARARSPACKYNPLRCSALALPPFLDTGNYAIHSVPGSASNHDSPSIRSHLSNVLEWSRREGLFCTSTHAHTHSHTRVSFYKWPFKDCSILTRVKEADVPSSTPPSPPSFSFPL